MKKSVRKWKFWFNFPVHLVFLECIICEIAYVILFTRTTYSRFTSTPIKRSRFLILLEDSKYVVELAYVSARFSPSGSIILPVGVFYGKGRFNENPKI
jgi:hypothetical protein